jgi:methyl halide transferase
MSELLSQEGRLICLEFPSYKPLYTPGPPWGVRPETYLALLSHPGEEISYDADGHVIYDDKENPGNGALKRLELVIPKRTHTVGIDEKGHVTDFISVWSH